MVRHAMQGTHPLSDLAPRAVAAHRALAAAARDHRAVLADRDRQVLDAALAALSDKGLFDPDALADAEAALAPLEAAVARAGGAPVRRWTEQGDGYLAGGTEAGRRIGSVRDELRAFLRLAWRVVDYLEAHDQLARRVGDVPGPKR